MADSRGASPQPRYIDRKPVNSMHTNTTTLRSFSSLFTALVIALPLTLSLTACDGVDEQDDVDALNEADEALEDEDSLVDADAEFVAAPVDAVDPADAEGAGAGLEADVPLADATNPTALCSNNNCNFKTPGSQGCLADAVNFNGWATFSNTFAVYPMVSASCGAQWSRVCNLAGYGGYGITGWDEYAPNAYTAKVNTANSGAPPAGYCIDSLMVNAAATYARACGSDMFGYTACSLYY